MHAEWVALPLPAPRAAERPGAGAARAGSSRPATGRHPAWLVLAASGWMATTGNLALWRALARLDDLSGWHSLVLGGALSLSIAAALSALLGALAPGRLLKPVVTLLLLASAAGAFFMTHYGVVIDSSMITNVFQTDAREAADLVSPSLVATLLLMAALPGVALWRWQVRPLSWREQFASGSLLVAGGIVVVAGTLLASFPLLSPVMRNHKELRYLANPLNTLYALGNLAVQQAPTGARTLQPTGLDVHRGPSYAAYRKPPLVVLVLGETTRGGNFAVNGYARPTTPELATESIISFRQAWSCGTNTATSVPCMFSPLRRAEFSKAAGPRENLLDVIQRAGLAVLWVDNQAGCKGVCARVPSVSTASITSAQAPGLCAPGQECYDGVMLRDLDARLADLPASRREAGTVVVLHQMGSHGPAYFKRAPPAYKRFMPECASNALQDCSREEVMNAYDNTIAYTDHFLASTIAWLKRHEADSETAMVYVGDHGESLGENNLYLHGLPYSIAPDLQKRVPWITWLSPGFSAWRSLSSACLAAAGDTPVSHDNYFHSVLGLLDLNTAAREPALDVYARCATP